MIFLTPILTEASREAGIAEVAKLAQYQKNQFRDMVESLYTASLNTKLTVTVSDAVSDEGRSYKNVEFIITTRFELDGTRYLSNGTFAIDYDTLVDLLHAIL